MCRVKRRGAITNFTQQVLLRNCYCNCFRLMCRVGKNTWYIFPKNCSSHDTPREVLGTANSLALRGFNTVDRVFFSKYLQEHYTRCITRAALFFKNVPGTFFNATHQVKAIAIGISEADPMGEISNCSSPLHSTHILYLIYTNFK